MTLNRCCRPAIRVLVCLGIVLAMRIMPQRSTIITTNLWGLLVSSLAEIGKGPDSKTLHQCSESLRSLMSHTSYPRLRLSSDSSGQHPKDAVYQSQESHGQEIPAQLRGPKAPLQPASIVQTMPVSVVSTPLRLPSLVSPVRSKRDAMVFRSTSVIRLVERMELPSTKAEITAIFFSAESVFILALTFQVGQAKMTLGDTDISACRIVG
jgi:hypothetical protein